METTGLCLRHVDSTVADPLRTDVKPAGRAAQLVAQVVAHALGCHLSMLSCMLSTHHRYLPNLER
jgi:hypothetical protein